MKDTYLTIQEDSQALFKDKGSKFYAFAYHVKDTVSIKEIIDKKRKEYYDARHVCYAYMLGHDRLEFRSNDDGEPSGTAGKPILGQINSADLTDILILVVRYFGGTLLGTSGLIRAYKTSALEAIEVSHIEEKLIEHTFQIDFPYEYMNAVQKIIKDNNLVILNQKFEMACQIIYKVRLTLEDHVTDKINNLDYKDQVKLTSLDSV